MKSSESTVIETFLATLPEELSYAEAEFLAAEEIRMSGLSRMAARTLGFKLREKFFVKTRA